MHCIQRTVSGVALVLGGSLKWKKIYHKTFNRSENGRWFLIASADNIHHTAPVPDYTENVHNNDDYSGDTHFQLMIKLVELPHCAVNGRGLSVSTGCYPVPVSKFECRKLDGDGTIENGFPQKRCVCGVCVLFHIVYLSISSPKSLTTAIS